MTLYRHYGDVATTDWVWPNFKPAELACRGTGALLLVPEFMDRLQGLRDLIGPLPVTSGYRTPGHNQSVGGARGVHDTGRAVDIAVSGERAFLIAGVAGELGFTGIGISQKGPHDKRFIHLDDLSDHETPGPRPWIWSY